MRAEDARDARGGAERGRGHADARAGGERRLSCGAAPNRREEPGGREEARDGAGTGRGHADLRARLA
jgi:hypothetical protein